ncbi:MAG: hypothetical protein J6X92_04990 [Bacteroidales bacterium]|nr:hypothetical protein [Bacteroidales bacterium]
MSKELKSTRGFFFIAYFIYYDKKGLSNKDNKNFGIIRQLTNYKRFKSIKYPLHYKREKYYFCKGK